MEKIWTYLFYFIVFPGLIFTAFVGLISSWIDRKVTARVQYRQGPPWYQNFADFFKLLGKETIVPEGVKGNGFLLFPLLGLTGITLVSTIMWVINLGLVSSFVGDLIVVLYLLTLPSLAVILGASASKNPLASIGASREMKLILAYELPFILAILVPILKSGGLIRIDELINYQVNSGAFLYSISGAISLIVAIICIQAKLGAVPFDMADAETEIMSGVSIEYSGTPLAVMKLTKSMMLFTLPVFLITIFWGGMHFNAVASSIHAILKYVILLVIIILIKNTNPRLRIDQAVKFFWGKLTLLAAFALVAAILGF